MKSKHRYAEKIIVDFERCVTHYLLREKTGT